MKKKLLAVFLTVCLLLCAMPVTAFADSVTPVYVGGVEMTAGDYLAVDADAVSDEVPAEGGYAYYDGVTLLLNNYTYEGKGYHRSTDVWTSDGVEYTNIYTAMIHCDGSLSLVLMGENALKSTADVEQGNTFLYDHGIHVEDELMISGSGSLYITSVNYEGIDADEILMTGGTLSGVTESDFIDAEDRFVMSGGTIDAVALGSDLIEVDYAVISGGTVRTAPTADGKYTADGIDAADALTVSGGTIDLTVDDNAVECTGDAVLISGGTVNLVADCYAIKSDTVSITGGEFTAATTGKGFDSEDEVALFSTAPLFAENLTVEASQNADGTKAVAYAVEDLADYRFLKAYTLKFAWLAGVRMVPGNYLAVDATVPSDQKPEEGGFAYYDGEKLVLHDFTYEGAGYAYHDFEDEDEYYYVILSDMSLELVLEGENTLSNTDEYGAAVVVDGSLTVSGNGSLSIEGGAEGLYASGTMLIKDGTVSVETETTGSWSVGIYATQMHIAGGRVLLNSGVGMAAESMEMSGGKLTVDAVGAGVDLSDGLLMDGGIMDITAGECGVIASEMTVNDGELTVAAQEEALAVSEVYIENASSAKGSSDITGADAETFDIDNIADYTYVYIPSASMMSSVLINGIDLLPGEYLAVNATSPTTVKPAEGGYVHFNKKLGLVLHDYTLTGKGTQIESSMSALIIGDGGFLPIWLEGNNTLTCTSEASVAIYMDHLLGFYGNGTLQATGTVMGIVGVQTGIYGGTITTNGIVTENFMFESGELQTASENGALIVMSRCGIDTSTTKVVASVKTDGSDPVAFDEADLQNYQYLKLTVNAEALAATADPVYIGETALPAGMYLANNSTTPATKKPIMGGYAYYDGTYLTLHDFRYSGEGYEYDHYSGTDGEYSEYAGVYAEGDIAVILEGKNEITVSGNDGVGILSENGMVEISGDGELTVRADYVGVGSWDDSLIIYGGTLNIYSAYGVYAYDGGLAIAGGAVNISSDYEGIYSDYADVYIAGGAVSISSGDEGIYSYEGDVYINGGTVNISSEYDGVYSDYGDIYVTGGAVSAVSNCHGIYSDYADVHITDGTVSVVSKYDGIYSCDGDVYINGGTVNLTSWEESGIDTNYSGDVYITGGTLNIDADYDGIVADNVEVTGGVVNIRTDSEGMCIDEYRQSGGVVTMDATGEDATDGLCTYEFYISGGELYAQANNYGIEGDGKITGGIVKVRGGEYGISGYVDYYYGLVEAAGGTGAGDTEWGILPYTEDLHISTGDEMDGAGAQALDLTDGLPTELLTVNNYVRISSTTTVRFVTEYGEAPEDQTVPLYGKLTEPTAPAAEDYVFVGWYADEALTQAWNFASPVVASQQFLYAKWVPSHYTVTFEMNGHGTAPVVQPVAYLDTFSVDAPTAQGYTFGGWYTDAALTVPYDFDTPVTENITLYAKWTAVPETPAGPSDGNTGGENAGNAGAGSTGNANALAGKDTGDHAPILLLVALVGLSGLVIVSTYKKREEKA